MTPAHTVHLIDASAYVFRAYFAIKGDMRAPDGRSVNAVYGFASFLLRYLADQRPTHAAVLFDESLTTSFRNEIYPDYKANRELPPEDLVDQFEDCEACAQALGFATFSSDRYEADDLIGTLAHRFGEDGHRALVVSPDKDLAQLVSDRVHLLDYAKEKHFDPAGVTEKFGVRPDQIPDYLGLVGDSVDNIPGVPGVGPKAAVALLDEWDHLEGVYQDLERVPDLPVRGARSLAGRLGEHREQAFLSRELATIALDAPVRADLPTLSYEGADRAEVEPLFEGLGFGRIRDRVRYWRA